MEVIDVISRFSTATVALGAAIVAFRQYTLARAENQIKRFFEIRTGFKANEHFQTILTALYSDHEALSEVSLARRIEFMGFFEDVAFLVKTEQMTKELAFYMFGGDAIAASKCTELWKVTDNAYWTLLHTFVEDMRAMEAMYIRNGKLVFSVFAGFKQ